MGTLGYLAPEVVTAGLSNENAYTDKCDIWSLGVVFVELLTGEPAFHRDAGQCDGYTEEVVLREIKEVTEDSIQRILGQALLCVIMCLKLLRGAFCSLEALLRADVDEGASRASKCQASLGP